MNWKWILWTTTTICDYISKLYSFVGEPEFRAILSRCLKNTIRNLLEYSDNKKGSGKFLWWENNAEKLKVVCKKASEDSRDYIILYLFGI